MSRAAIEPRGLSKAAAAAYVGCDSLSTFSDWIQRGIMPGPIPGTQRWDRKAIDVALDRASGLAPTIALSDPLGEWKAKRARESQRHP